MQPVEENYANPKTCFFMCSSSFVIIFVITVVLAALDFWVVKNSLARINKKDSWLFWWTLHLNAAAWIIFATLSLLRFQADYLLVVGVCLSRGIANIVGFTKYRKETIITIVITSYLTALRECREWAAQPGQSNKKFMKLRELIYATAFLREKEKRSIDLVVGRGPFLNSNWLGGFVYWIEDARKKIQAFASQTIASRVSSTIQSAFGV
ncbi:hypothetical protein QUC31_004997, partial [Theobroma cacao]